MVTSSETQATQATTWKVDPAHSLVEFSTKHMMFTTVKGRFTSVRGTIVDDPADPTRSSVEAEIDVASIDTREEQRDNHLRSADFFDAGNHRDIGLTWNQLGMASMRNTITIHAVFTRD
jgi:polyisoprenoid-binding protein YceI